MKKLKEIEGSKLLIRKIVDRFIDEQGINHIKTQWFVAEQPVNFGSYKDKQNEDIIEYKYEFPPEKIDPNSFFGRLMGGLK